jgi:hypothetical protein
MMMQPIDRTVKPLDIGPFANWAHKARAANERLRAGLPHLSFC